MTTGPYKLGARMGTSHAVSGLPWWAKYIHTIDCFDRGLSRQNFGGDYDIATLAIGGGTNDVTTVVSHNALITGGVIGNQEGTRVHDLMALRSRETFIEIDVKLATDIAIDFKFGFYKDANEFVYIEFDKSVNDNWRLTIDDGTGQEWSTEVVAVNPANHYFLRLWVETDGTPHWAVGTTIDNIIEIGTTGIANKMTADGHYIEYKLATEAGAAKQADIDFLEIIKTKIGG